MIDPENETLIDFAAAARKLPRSASGRPLHAKTVARWALRGIRGLKLESLMIGGRRVTSVEACRRFFNELTRLTDTPRSPASPNVSSDLAARGYA